ncbi:hypothetical protein KO465_09325 [Candidatus Micrarchaeota archaeon]|nr:hypothetical protein [Candidatus Micrarchaeota archaeon]
MKKKDKEKLVAIIVAHMEEKIPDEDFNTAFILDLFEEITQMLVYRSISKSLQRESQ